MHTTPFLFWAETCDRYARIAIKAHGHEGRVRTIVNLVREAATPGYRDWQSEACLAVAMLYARQVVHEFDAAEAARLAREQAEVVERERIAANWRAYLEHDAIIQRTLAA